MDRSSSPVVSASPSAVAAWVCDALAAVLFALALAQLLSLQISREIGGDGETGWGWGLLLIASALLRGGAQGAAALFGQRAAAVATAALRARLAPALMTSATARGRIVGEDAELAIAGIDRIEPYLARFLPLRRAAMLSPLLIALAAFFASWVSAAILLATLIPFGFGMALAGGAARKASDDQFGALARLGGLFVDRVRALPLILSFGAEERVARHIGAAASDLAERTLGVLRIAFLSSAILEFFSALAVALVAVYCGFALLGLLPFAPPERLDFVRAFFVLALAPEYYMGMRRLAAAYHDKQQGEAALAALAQEERKISERIENPPRTMVTTLALADLVVRHPGGVAIGSVDAAWPATGLHVMTGPSGAGKTSLLRALIGQVPIERGQIRLDTVAVDPCALAATCGWSGQRALLLPATLRANLLLSRWGVADADALDLLDAVGLGGLIADRGAGLDWSINDRGSGLSGGERRRIGLVRALLAPRPILLLDEPTADLDRAAAESIVALLVRTGRDRLIVTATHDPLLVAAADSRIALP